MSESSTLSDHNNQSDGDKRASGAGEETRWKEVASTAGIMAAQILAGRLQSEGIPARAWQEGAGQAMGLSVGLLGTGHVVVPEEYVEKAREILADVDYFADEDDEE